MNDKQIDTLTSVLYSFSIALVLIGAFFRLQHYPHGLSLLVYGFLLGAIISVVDRSRLKRKIKQLEERLNSLK